MPLRNERQAYWDDIELNIAAVDPLSWSGALDRVCPDAAAVRMKLKQRLEAIDQETKHVNRLRERAAAEAKVLAKGTDAVLDLQVKEQAFSDAQRFVRGRLENDRVSGQRPGMARPEHNPRAAVGNVPRGHSNAVRGQMPFIRPTPAVYADQFRERNERWGSGVVNPLMGGGYTVVLQRASRDLEEANVKRDAAERERELYFMKTSSEPDLFETSDTDFSTIVKERTSAGMALRGWNRGDTRRGHKSHHRDENENSESLLPPPRGSSSGTNQKHSSNPGVPNTVNTSGYNITGSTTVSRNQSNRNGSGYGAQMALIGTGASNVQPQRSHRYQSSRSSLVLR